MYEIFEKKEDNEEIYRFYCNNDNFKVEDISNDVNKPVYIFFTGHGLFFPTTIEMFRSKVIENNRFEWENIARGTGVQSKASRIIYIRDVYKNWCINGINSKVNTREKLVEMLKDLAENREIITVGSSAGGYMAVLYGRGNRVPIKIMRLRMILKQINPDSVIELGFAIKYIIMGGLLHKYNYIFSLRNDPVLWEKDSKSIFKYLRNYYFDNAKYVVFQTEEARAYFSASIQKKGVIIPNMIKEGLPMPYEGERVREVVTFCRLNSQKNIYMLLRAFKIFLEDHNDYVLKLYGRGEEEDRLKVYANELGISDKVWFCGFNSNIHNDILRSMMYVNSSDYEGISNSMIEALAIGIPTICTDCPPGGAKMFIRSGENGILVPVGDYKAMAKAMATIADDSKLRQKFSQNSIEIRKELDLLSICKKWESLI